MRQQAGRLARLMRASDDFAKHNYAVVLLLAVGAAVLGSGFTVLVWGCFAWNAICWMCGRLDAPLDRHERIFCTLIACYPAAVLFTSVINPGALTVDWLRKILPLLIFLAPAILLKRFSGPPAIRYKRILVTGALIGCAISLVMSVATQLFAEFQPEGFAGNSYPFAVAVLISGSFAALALPARHPLSAMGLISLCFAIVAVLLSESRAVMASLPIILVIVAWRHHWRFGSMLRQRSILAASIISILALLQFASVIWTRFELVPVEISRFYREKDTTSSIGKRLAMWEGGWSLAVDAPVLGYGVQNRDRVMAEAANRSSSPALFGVRHFHNFILTAMIDGGIVTVLALFATLFAPLYYAVASKRHGGDRTRLTMALSLAVIYAVGGLSAIALGHDILDSMFIFFACFLIFATGPQARLQS
jgi:O-antigen ligase